MTMINTPLVLLAQQCGGTFHTPGPMRAIRGMAFTFDQLDALAERLRAKSGQHALAPGSTVRAFREYLAVHPALQLGGQAMDDMALELTRVAMAFTGTPALEAIRQALREYHHDLDTRQHGTVAAGKALDTIQAALGLCWVQGSEAAARAKEQAHA